ncbi:MAG: hypothetical protein H0U49_08940 [Parachlamydiaceae bacterium]|nr:hypothetical protein [Parachlamydiaceae bacterium]
MGSLLEKEGSVLSATLLITGCCIGAGMIGLPVMSASGFIPTTLAMLKLVLVPPTLLTLLYPHLFLRALGVAGGFADVLLFGVLPVTIVWIGRYYKNAKRPFTAPGGKLFLIAILLFSLGFLTIRN